MKTLKEINKYLEELEATKTLKSARGNIYNCKVVSYDLLKELIGYKSTIINYHEVNGFMLVNYKGMYLLQVDKGTNKEKNEKEGLI